MVFSGGIRWNHLVPPVVNISFKINPSEASFSISFPKRFSVQEYQMGTLARTETTVGQKQGTETTVKLCCAVVRGQNTLLTFTCPSQQISKWSLISNVIKMYVHSNILDIFVNTLVLKLSKLNILVKKLFDFRISLRGVKRNYWPEIRYYKAKRGFSNLIKTILYQR